jgi:hypothetical protein
MFDDLASRFGTEAAKAALDVLFERISEALRNKPFWQRPRSGRIVRAVGARLDDLLLDLRPCFVLGKHASILEAFWSSSTTQDEEWKRTYYVLNVIESWFLKWDSMRQAVGTLRTPEVLVQQFESLNMILTHLGFVAADVSKGFANLAPGDSALMSFKAVADRYNHFLTEYEALLRRLPQEVGIDPPHFGRDHFFIRL